MPHRNPTLHDMYYARAFPAYGHHLPHHSYPESNGRSTPDSDYSYDSKSRMRWILSLGLLLPALAAIIGVVAWAVSAEVVMGAHRESALKASEAFRLSQGPRDLEWRAVQEDDINHISNSNMNLAPPRLSAVRESGSPVSIDPTEDYEDPDTDEDSEQTTTTPTTTTSTTTTTTTTVAPVTTKVAPVATVTPTRRSTSSTTKKSTGTSTTTVAPSKISGAKRKEGGVRDLEDSLAKLASKDGPVNASTIFFLNGGDSASDEAGKSGRKKSPGDQVADVINRLVAQRQGSGVTRHPHIVVVAPLHDSRKNNKSSSASRSFMSPTLAPRGSSINSLNAWSPRTSKKPAAKTTSAAGKKNKGAIDDAETTTKAPILSKDADTLLAAAQMLAARHKIISMRNDDDDDDDSDEDEEEGPNRSNKIDTTRPSSSSPPSPPPFPLVPHTEAAPSTTPLPVHRFQPISAPHPYPHPLQPSPPHAPQSAQYPHPNLHAPQAPPTHHHMRHMGQASHPLPSVSSPVSQQQLQHHPAFPSLSPPHPPPNHHVYHQRVYPDRMGQMPLAPMASHYAPTHAVHPSGRSYPPPSQLHQQRLQAPAPYGPQVQSHPHQVFPLPSNPQMRFLPHNMRLGPHAPPHMAHNHQPQFIRGPHGQLIPVQMGGPYPMGPPIPSPTPAEAEETATEAADESQVENSYQGADSNPNKAVVQFHAEDPQPAASGANKGLTLHFGGGPVGGGGQLMTNPVGIFKTLLLPLLPKHHANFNGKLVFGFVLEKGVKKQVKPMHPVVKFLPSHLYRH